MLSKNKMNALNLMNKIKGKINPMEVVMCQMMPKIKFMPPSPLKVKSKLKTVLNMCKIKSQLKIKRKLKTVLTIKSKLKTVVKMCKMILKCPLRNFWSVVPLRWLPS